MLLYKLYKVINFLFQEEREKLHNFLLFFLRFYIIIAINLKQYLECYRLILIYLYNTSSFILKEVEEEEEKN
jgi:hypothetical protein